jgi:hypothetical protein
MLPAKVEVTHFYGITLLNYIVKERVKELLSDYFNSCNYDKTVYID